MSKFFEKLFGKTRATPPSPAEPLPEEVIVPRPNKKQVFNAWTSGDLNKMLDVLDVKTNKIDRHFLLMGIVDITYKEYADPKMAELCATIAELHLKEFPKMVAPLMKEMDGTLPQVNTFKKYASLLIQTGNLDRALFVCDQAISYGLKDGTKGCFKGTKEYIEWLKIKRSGI